MLNWVTANLSTIIVSAILLAIIIAISTYLIRQRKRGRNSCGCTSTLRYARQFVTVSSISQHSGETPREFIHPRPCAV